MIRCADGSLYTGVTTDVSRRVQEHSGKQGRGAKYLKGKGPLEVVWQEPAESRSQAQQMEYQIKKLTRGNKERLIKGDTDIHQLLGISD